MFTTQIQLKLFGLLFIVLTTVAPPASKKAPTVALGVSTERPNAVYQLGEEVRFLVTLSKDGQPFEAGKVTYILDDEGPNLVSDGSIEMGAKPATLSGKLDKPGFLRCRVTFQPMGGKALHAVAAAAVSPEKIEPSMPAPDDFDEFWAEQKAELAKVPMEPKFVPVSSSDSSVECFDVQIPCAGGAPVSGYYARPKEAKPKSLSAVLWVHGAGVRSSNRATAVKGATRGMISMDINAHGIQNGQPRKFYTDLAKGELANYRRDGRDSRDTCYFRGMYRRLIRAIDFLTTQPEWNGKVLGVIGHSQGGGQALVAGGLDPRVTFIGTGVPAMCDHTGMVIRRINGWPKLVPNGPDGKPEPKSLQASRYFDAVNFARRCQTDAIMSIGFVDRTCPPTSCYAAYNQLQGKKEMIHEPTMGHAAPSRIHKAFLEAFKRHAAEMAE